MAMEAVAANRDGASTVSMGSWLHGPGRLGPDRSLERARLLRSLQDSETTRPQAFAVELRSPRALHRSLWRSTAWAAGLLGLVLVTIAIATVCDNRVGQRWKDLFPVPGVGRGRGLNRHTGLASKFSVALVKSRLCNASMPVPQIHGLRRWRLEPSWRRVCEEKMSRKDYAWERNWCWVGMKMQCHAHLKAHRSWTDIQHFAAEAGKAPPVSDATFHPLEAPEMCDASKFGQSRDWTADEILRARQWFDKQVRVYVLNLDTDTSRWEMSSKRLQQLGIRATRVPGVDMRTPGAVERAKRDGWVPKAFNFTRSQALAYSRKHQMGSILGTFGCAAAHFKAQATALESGRELAVVLEDDSWPHDDFVPRLWSLVREELPCDWEAVALMSRCPYGRCVSPHLARVQPDANEPAWRCRQGVNWGMHGVLYRIDKLEMLQWKWKQVVFDEERPHCMDVDVALASISDQVAYYAVPAVQEPGFLFESNHPSARWNINQAGRTTTTATPPISVRVLDPQ
mmetsp:Transcript_8304/g.18106  ORF Transcript_8304/g.18106 Transcript_8304/m.18106 type:complete len:512 (-) Transcript_8304:46-1581(-)